MQRRSRKKNAVIIIVFAAVLAAAAAGVFAYKYFSVEDGNIQRVNVEDLKFSIPESFTEEEVEYVEDIIEDENGNQVPAGIPEFTVEKRFLSDDGKHDITISKQTIDPEERDWTLQDLADIRSFGEAVAEVENNGKTVYITKYKDGGTEYLEADVVEGDDIYYVDFRPTEKGSKKLSDSDVRRFVQIVKRMDIS